VKSASSTAAIGRGDTAVDQDFAFHCEIADATGNPQFKRFLEYLGRFIIPRRKVWGRSAPPSKRVQLDVFQQEHEQILNAIRDRAVTQARAASMNAASIGEKAVADLKMASALRGLFAVAENYPQLKANENFLKLQTRISELEERIADRREFFNDDVNSYNTRIAQIPDVFVASFMNLKPRQMFKVSDEDRKLVEVKFQGQGAAGA